MKRVVTDLVHHANSVSQGVFNEYWSLVYSQRLLLFRALITFLHLFVSPEPLSESVIRCITLHTLAQAVVDLDYNLKYDEDEPTIEIEPTQTSPDRIERKVPRWLVKGMKLYYLAVRPHFIRLGKTIAPKVQRRFRGETIEVTTEPLFCDISGSFDFRVKTVADEFTATVSASSQFDS